MMRALLARAISRLFLFPPMAAFLAECVAVYYYQIWPSFPTGLTEFKQIATFVIGALFEIWLVIVTVAAVLVWFWELSEYFLFYAERIERRQAMQRRLETPRRSVLEAIQNFESPLGLDPDVWLLIIAKLQLFSVARLSMANKFFQNASWLGVSSIKQFDIWDLSVDSKNQLVRNRPDTGADDWFCRLLQKLQHANASPHLSEITFPPTAPYILQEMIERTSKLSRGVQSLRLNRVLSEMPYSSQNPVSHKDACTALSLALAPIWSTPSLYSSLTSLDLQELSGYARFPFPSYFVNLSNLVELILPAELVAPMSTLARLTHLTRLACLLTEQDFLQKDSGEDPEQFPRTLRDLRLHRVVAGPLLRSLTNIEMLALDNLYAAEMDWDLLQSATRLTRLDLSRSTMDQGCEVAIFRALPHLRRLDPSIDPHTDPRLMPHLTRLQLDSNFSRCVEFITTCRNSGSVSNLEHLEFSFGALPATLVACLLPVWD